MMANILPGDEPDVGLVIIDPPGHASKWQHLPKDGLPLMGAALHERRKAIMQRGPYHVAIYLPGGNVVPPTATHSTSLTIHEVRHMHLKMCCQPLCVATTPQQTH